MSHYNPYSAYKDSGVEWLGSFPENWTSKKIMYWISGHGSGTTPSEEADYCEVGFPWVTTGELRENIVAATAKQVTQNAIDKNSALKIHPKDSLVIAMYGATVGRLGVLGIPATLNQACFAIHPCKQLKMPFMRWWFEGFRTELIGLATGAGQPNISGDKIKNLFLAAPTSEMEQDQIVDHLDCETARIDGLVAKKTRFIDLLREKRQTLITHAVTKGLNADVKMKDSGVEWLGEVPKHWDIVSFQRCVMIAQGQVDPEVLPFREMILLGPNHIESGSGKILFVETAEQQHAESGKYLCEEGDIVYSKIRPALRKVCVAPFRCLCSADMYPLRAHSGMTNVFLFWFLLSEPFSAFAVLEADRVAMPKINRESLNEVALPRPIIEDQLAIARFLERETKRIDGLIGKTELSIELLKERRSALITAAVTGQIDVREAA